MVWEVGKGLLFICLGLELLTSIFSWLKNRKYSCLVYATKDAKQLFLIANQLSALDIPFIVRFHNSLRPDMEKRLTSADNPFMRYIYVEKRNVELALHAISNKDKEQEF